MNSQQEKKNSWTNLNKLMKKSSSFSDLSFFANLFEQHYGIEYTINNAQDLDCINKIKMSLRKLGLDPAKHLRNFLSWMINHTSLAPSYNFIILQHYDKFIESYVKSLDECEVIRAANDPTFLKRLEKDCSEGLLVDVLIKYGIPVTASYLNKISQKRNVTIGNIRRTMTKLINNNELDIINKIARQSIYLSPYPNTFLLLNWREEFEEILIKTNAKSKNWWRQNDYSNLLYAEHFEGLI
jgi:hypothetical protein